jgi:hypothetical protein
VKVACGYVGTVAGLKLLIRCNLLNETAKGRIPFRHINRHGYMKKLKGGGSA